MRTATDGLLLGTALILMFHGLGVMPEGWSIQWWMTMISIALLSVALIRSDEEENK